MKCAAWPCFLGEPLSGSLSAVTAVVCDCRIGISRKLCGSSWNGPSVIIRIADVLSVRI